MIAAHAPQTVVLPTSRVGPALCASAPACVLLGPVRAGKGTTQSQAQKVDATLAATLQPIIDGRVERYEDARRRAAQLGKVPTQAQCKKGDCLTALGRELGVPFIALPELVLTEAGLGLTFYVSSVSEPEAQRGGLILGTLDNLASAAWLHPHLWVKAAEQRGLPIRRDPKSPAPSMEWIFSQAAGVRFAKTETTLAQYRACVEAGACVTSHPGEQCNWEHKNREDHPVNCVSSDDATAFCSWVGGRLPSDAEWFAEASNAGRRRFAWGGDPKKAEDDALFDCAHVVFRGPEGPRGCGRTSTANVCSLPAGNSVSDLCDMSGNLWEWTLSAGSAQARERGGSWEDRGPLVLSLEAAEHDRRFVSWGELGFRCVRPQQ